MSLREEMSTVSNFITERQSNGGGYFKNKYFFLLLFINFIL